MARKITYRASWTVMEDKKRQRLTLAAMCISQFMIMLDVTIVNIALPSMQRELGMSPGSLEWVVSAYALSLAALIPFGGALGDRYGRKRWFLIGLAVFALGSVGCAVSPSAGALIAFRAVQGVGGALMSALTLSILSRTFPRERRAHAIGTWASLGGLGFGAGPVFGGILLSFAGWSSVFWVNVPIAALAIALTIWAVGESREGSARRLDLPGVATSALGLLGVTFGLIESSSHPWGSGLVTGSMAAGVALLALFVAVEARVASPMVPLALLRSRSFTASTTLYLFNYLALTGVMFYMTLLYQDVDGWSVLRTGLSWLLMNIPFTLTAQSAGRLHSRFSSRAVITFGALAFAVSLVLLSQVTTTTPFIVTAVGFVLIGLGPGALVPAVTHAAMRDVPAAVSGAASGVLNAGRQVGTSIGLAVLGAIGVRAATASWSSATAALPAGLRAAAAAQSQRVGGGQISSVTGALGDAVRDMAVRSYLHGEQLALLVAAGCMVFAAAVALIGLRERKPAAVAVPAVTANDPGREVAVEATGDF